MPPGRILRISKRPRPLFPQHPRPKSRHFDPEKAPLDPETDWHSLSPPSSRSSSSSSPPTATLLSHAPSRRLSTRHNCNLIFTLLLGAVLVATALALALLGQASTRAAAAAHPAPQNPISLYFPEIKSYYGGVRALLPRNETVAEYPGDADALLREIQGAVEGGSGAVERREERGPRVGSRVIGEGTCEGLGVPGLRAYEGVPPGFPEQVIGSYGELGLDAGVCFDRFGRLGPYGLGYTAKFGGTSAGMEGDREGAELVWAQARQVDYRHVNWADVVSECAQAHSTEAGTTLHSERRSTTEETTGGKTAILVRTWSDYVYDAEDIMFLRALVHELAVASSGQYKVHFLIHVRDDNIEFWTDETAHSRLLREALPAEFHGMASLWSSKQLSLLYPGLGASAYTNEQSTFLPVQHFAQRHPEFAFVWNWEMDVRYTGPLKQLLDRAHSWAQAQPRKGLWERSARFYVPADHGSWTDFVQMVRVQTEHKMTSSSADVYARLGIAAQNPRAEAAAQTLVWGPELPEGQSINETDPQPPHAYHVDKYEWGVGEDADLVTLNPIFNPDGPHWESAEDVSGYAALPPRRASIGTTLRLSRRLLDRMQHETVANQHHMTSELWPASVALHRGLKAVYLPHPVYIDRKWPVDYLAAVFNGGRNGAAGGARLSVFSDDRDHVFAGTTWYEDAGFGAKLWKRWLGYRVDGEGGEEWELSREGRMCLPAMLLHPVKQIDLVYADDV